MPNTFNKKYRYTFLIFQKAKPTELKTSKTVLTLLFFFTGYLSSSAQTNIWMRKQISEGLPAHLLLVSASAVKGILEPERMVITLTISTIKTFGNSILPPIHGHKKPISEELPAKLPWVSASVTKDI
jgi:hypothetical protein